MIGVTFFGLFFTPVFYNVIRGFIERGEAKKPAGEAPAGAAKEASAPAPAPAPAPAAKGAAHGLLLAVTTALVVSASGCRWIQNGFEVGPDYVEPKTDVAERWLDYKDPRVKSQEQNLAEWWTIFNDPALAKLEEMAYGQNLSLKAAGARILEARARYGIAVGNIFPQLQEAAGSYSNNVASDKTNFPVPDRWFPQWEAGFNLAWELDFWGRFRRGIEAADADLEASVHDYDDVLVILLSDVASAYVQYRTFEERLVFARQNVEIQRKSYELAQDKFKAGAVTERDVQQAKQVLEQTRALVPQLEAGRRQQSNALCVLLGISPRDLTDILGRAGKIPVAPREVTIGIPADLLRRRPDVRRAERVAARESAFIGVAEADFYPRFSLLGSIGVQAEFFKNLWFWPESLAGSIGPQFRWDILNYGRITHSVRAQEARFEQSVYAYQDSVLRAGREAEDAAIGFLKAHETTDALVLAVDAARRTVEITNEQYTTGVIDFTPVFIFQATLTGQQDTLAQSRGSIALNLIALYRALGGGWEMRLTRESKGS